MNLLELNKQVKKLEKNNNLSIKNILNQVNFFLEIIQESPFNNTIKEALNLRLANILLPYYNGNKIAA